MSHLYKAAELCERSLRKIGVTVISESAPRPEHVAESLHWLDMMMGHAAGTNKVYWLVPATVSMPLTGGVSSYDIQDTLGANSPADGVQFITGATLNDGQGNITPLDIVTRQAFDEILVPDTSGRPDRVYIDRLIRPTLHTYPVLGAGQTGFSIDLTLISYAQDFTAGKGNRGTDMRPAWNLWCVTNLAALIGDGPVRKLPGAEIDRIKTQATTYWNELMARENWEHDSAHQTPFRDF